MEKSGKLPDVQGVLSEIILVKEEHISYLMKVKAHLLENKDEQGYISILEKMLHLILEFFNNPSNKKLNINYFDDVTHYLEILNKKAVENFNYNKLEEASRVIAHAVDLLNHKNILRLFPNELKLYEFKILTYNNLSCIYRKLKKLSNSARVVSYAIDLEEKLVAHKYGNSQISIISTYINRSAILSEMKDHAQALSDGQKAIESLDKIGDLKSVDEGERDHLIQLRMLAYYIMGVESEHLKKNPDAISNYNKALEIAKQIGKTDVVNKINKALTALNRKQTISIYNYYLFL